MARFLQGIQPLKSNWLVNKGNVLANTTERGYVPGFQETLSKVPAPLLWDALSSFISLWLSACFSDLSPLRFKILQWLQIWHVHTELSRWTACTQQKAAHLFWFYLFRLLGWGDDLWSPHRTQKRQLGGWPSQRGVLGPGNRKQNQVPWNNMDQAEKSGCCLSACLFFYLSFIHWGNNAICPVSFFY